MGINLGEIAAGVDEIIARQQAQALQATVDSILQGVNAELALTRGLVGQVVAVQNSINTLTAQLSIDITAILTAIADLSATGTGGVLIGAVSTSALGEIGNEVWTWPIPTEGTAAEVCLADAHYFALYRSNAGEAIRSPYGGDNAWRMIGNWNEPEQQAFDESVPFALDYTTMLASDQTAFDWLTRVYPLSWTDLGDGLPALPDPGANTYWWQVAITQDDFLELKAALGLTAATAVGAPIWPGLAGVTLLSTVALSDGLVISGPVDGVIVAILTVPVPIGFYAFGTRKSFVKAGSLIFVDDNGDMELAHSIGGDSQVVVPQSMARATQVIFRVTSGVTGTVTPFTIP